VVANGWESKLALMFGFVCYRLSSHYIPNIADFVSNVMNY